MEKRIKLDLSGINLVKPVIPGADRHTSQTGERDKVDDIVTMIKPKQSNDVSETSTKFLERAILNKRKTFHERLASLPAVANNSNSSNNGKHTSNSDTASASMQPEQFAKALMRGMGWREGEPCQPGGPIESTVYVSLPDRVGLGFGGGKSMGQFTVGSSQLKNRKPTMAVGDRVSIISGPHCGLSGILNAKMGVTLDVSGAIVVVEKRDMTMYDPTPVNVSDTVDNTTTTITEYPQGSVCLSTSKSRNAHLYYHQVVVVSDKPLIIRTMDDRQRVYKCTSSAVLRPVQCTVGDCVVCLDKEHYGTVGKLLQSDSDGNNIVLSDGDSNAFKCRLVTMYTNL